MSCLASTSARAVGSTVRTSQKRLLSNRAGLSLGTLSTARGALPATTSRCFEAKPLPSSGLGRLQQSAFTTSAATARASPLESQAPQSLNDVPLGSAASIAPAQDGPVVSLDDAQSKIIVRWTSGIESRYHNVWLRDHCRCPKCYHQQTKQRQLDTFAIPLDIKPLSVEATAEGLVVYWPRSDVDDAPEYTTRPSAVVSMRDPPGSVQESGHKSVYPWHWLYANSYSPQTSDVEPSFSSASDLVLWNSGIAQQPPKVTWQEVMDENDDKGLARWLSKIAQYGFCFVSGVPATPEDTERLIERIAFIRETHYGGFWDFTSDLSHGDTAYTNLALGAHTDTTYFTDPAGLQMFHLLSHVESQKGNERTPAQGGESLLVDGFFAAKILREVYPEAYRVLSTVTVSTHSAGDDDTLIRPLQRGGYSILEHDARTGELIRVRYNNDDRSVLRVRDEDVLPFYDALGKWHRILTNSDSEYWSQLSPGTALIFDNHRVLHGRSAFTGARRLCGAYVNHDDYRSRCAVLLKRFPELLGAPRKTLTNAPGRDASMPFAASGQAPRRGVWDDAL